MQTAWWVLVLAVVLGGCESNLPTASSDAGVARACAAPGCGAEVPPLDAYCRLEHARCPSSMAEARLAACANTFAQPRSTMTNSCGGQSVRVYYAYGNVTFLFNDTGKLSAVRTHTESKGGSCYAQSYLYGSPQCNSFENEAPLACTN